VAAAARAFVRQSPYSDYCAVYATATWLGLRGATVSRRQALRWFDVRPGDWNGASHAQIAEVVAQHRPEAMGRWRRLLPPSSQDLHTAIGDATRSGPLLLTAMCELRQPRVRCRHAFVVTACRAGRIELLDPLGRPPGVRSRYNAWLDTGGSGRHIDVHGAGWWLDLRSCLWIFMPEVGPDRARR
jgi:hypothetical protein